MKAITLDSIARGEAKSYTFEFRNADGTLMDLAGKRILATMRYGDSLQIEKRSATISGGSTDQVEIIAPSTLGKAKIKLAPVDTANLPPCRLEGDLWVYTTGTDPVRVARFVLPIEQAQTRSFPM